MLKKRRLFVGFVLLVMLAGLAGCAKVESTNVKSQGIYATFRVVGNSADKAYAEAVFQVGGSTGTHVSLEGGDNVTCDGEPMQKVTGVFGEIKYTREFSSQPDKTYQFKFSRNGEDPRLATAVLPDPIVVSAPLEGAKLKAGEPVEVKWKPGATQTDTVGVTVSGSNGIFMLDTQSPDTGSQMLLARHTETHQDVNSHKLTITISRKRAGGFPVGLDGGISEGVQEKTITVTAVK